MSSSSSSLIYSLTFHTLSTSFSPSFRFLRSSIYHAVLKYRHTKCSCVLLCRKPHTNHRYRDRFYLHRCTAIYCYDECDSYGASDCHNPVVTTGSSGVKTVGGTVTSCDYSGSLTIVYVWPIASNGQTSTVIIINADKPSSTPAPPLPQSTSSQIISASTTIATIQTHTVQLGALGQLIYGPNQLNAALGDVVRFDALKAEPSSHPVEPFYTINFQ